MFDTVYERRAEAAAPLVLSASILMMSKLCGRWDLPRCLFVYRVFSIRSSTFFCRRWHTIETKSPRNLISTGMGPDAFPFLCRWLLLRRQLPCFSNIAKQYAVFVSSLLLFLKRQQQHQPSIDRFSSLCAKKAFVFASKKFRNDFPFSPILGCCVKPLNAGTFLLNWERNEERGSAMRRRREFWIK